MKEIIGRTKFSVDHEKMCLIMGGGWLKVDGSCELQQINLLQESMKRIVK